MDFITKVKEPMTPDSIIKITKALLKGLSDNEHKMIAQYLIRRNINWYTLSKIGELTGSHRETVQSNISRVVKTKYLLDMATDVELLIRC